MVRAGEAIAKVEVRSRREWRDWLTLHHDTSGSIWLITWKKAPAARVGLDFIGYDALVEEALCFGWIDSLPRALDAERTMLLMSQRKSGSAWSKVNRERVDRLIVAGMMAPAGLAAIERATADGGWSRLVEVDALVLPPDLATALATDPTAEHFFSRFPPSSRRAILEWIAQARTEHTRAMRIAQTVARAAQNRKANFPAGRDTGPSSASERTKGKRLSSRPSASRPSRPPPSAST